MDSADKCIVYGNWLGLMKGDLEESVDKEGRTTDNVVSARNHLRKHLQVKNQ